MGSDGRRLTCQVLRASDGQSYCCQVDWRREEGTLPPSFDITLTDGTSAWRASDVQCPPEWSPRQEWLEHASDALTAVAKRAAYSYHATCRGGGALRMQWTWPLPSGGLRKGQVELAGCGSESAAVVSELLFAVVNSYSLQMGAFDALHQLVSRQGEQLGAAHRQLQELAEEKRRGEEKLFEKFARGWPRPPAGAVAATAAPCAHRAHRGPGRTLRGSASMLGCPGHSPPAAAAVPPTRRPGPRTPHPHPAAVVLNEKKAHARALQERAGALEELNRELRSKISEEADKWVCWLERGGVGVRWGAGQAGQVVRAGRPVVDEGWSCCKAGRWRGAGPAVCMRRCMQGRSRRRRPGCSRKQARGGAAWRRRPAGSRAPPQPRCSPDPWGSHLPLATPAGRSTQMRSPARRRSRWAVAGPGSLLRQHGAALAPALAPALALGRLWLRWQTVRALLLAGASAASPKVRRPSARQNQDRCLGWGGGL
jgi:hypothetical protein